VGSLTTTVAWISLVGAALLSVWACWREGLYLFSMDKGPAQKKLGAGDWQSFVLVILVSFPLWGFNLIHQAGGWHTFNRFNLGDAGWHIQLIEYFANGAPFWPENPMYSGAKLVYPFGIELYLALWRIIGVQIEGLFMLIAAVGLSLATVLLFRRSGLWGVFALWLSGGLLFTVEPTWKNLIYTMLLTQISLLFAVPIGIYLISQTMRKVRWHWYDYFLFSLMPWLNFYSFASVGMILVVFGIWLRLNRFYFSPKGVTWVFVSGLIFVGSLIRFHGNGVRSAVSWSLFWDWDSKTQSLFTYLFQNWGLWLIGILIALIYLKSIRRPLALILCLFGLFHFLMVATWKFDNTKVFIWIYFAMNLLIGQALAERKWSWSILYAVATFAAGFNWHYNYSPLRNSGYGLITESALNETLEAIKGLDTKALWMTDMSYNHPLQWLGMRRFAGYDGHIYSHGYDLDLKSSRLTEFVKDPKAARNEGIQYLYWSNREQGKFGVLSQEWNQYLVYDGPVKIYRIQ
jgi:hypothetical protein